MESIIATFHIDWQLMIAQLVNFAIVVAVLWFFVFKPLNKVMTERGQKIETSLKEAEEISKKLQSAQEEKEEILKVARQEAQAIIEKGKTNAETSQKKTVEETQEKVRKIVEESKVQLAQHKAQMIKEAEGQITDLVVLASQAVLRKVTDKKIDKALAAQTLKEIDKK